MFSDAANHWAKDDINQIARLGLIEGFNDGRFHPDDNMTRAQFAMILWRMAGKPEASSDFGFTDLRASWYEQAVNWAAEKGYITGISPTTFSPDNYITRQEIAVILFRYSGSKSGQELLFTSTYNSIYTDSGQIASWGRNAMYWAIYNELINGITKTTLVPDGNATRAQVSTIIARYLRKNVA
jgi:hypothetical protein